MKKAQMLQKDACDHVCDLRPLEDRLLCSLSVHLYGLLLGCVSITIQVACCSGSLVLESRYRRLILLVFLLKGLITTAQTLVRLRGSL